MAKKKHKKKHNFKYSTPATNTSVAASAGVIAPTVKANAKHQPPGLGDFTHVSNEVRHISVLAVSFVALQFILWYLFEHTPLGPSIYHLIMF